MDNQVTEEQWNKIFLMRDTFAEMHFDRDLYGYQKKVSNKIIQLVVTHEGGDSAIEFCRQSGKTETVCITTVFLLLHYYQICKHFGLHFHEFFHIGIFAPQEEQAKTDFNRIKEYLQKCQNKGYDFNFDTFNGNEITLLSSKTEKGTFNIPVRRVYCFSASPTSNTESKTLNVIILEEAQDLTDFKLDKTILPMGTNTNSTNIYIGTAGYAKCRLWHNLETLPEDRKLIVPDTEAIEERRIKYQETKNPVHLNYEKVIKRIDKTTDEYKTQYALKWVLERGQFITFDELMKLEEDYEIMKTYTKIYNVIIGIDWGKAHDSTVATFIDKDTGGIIEWMEFNGDDYASQIMDLVDKIDTRYRKSVRGIYCDSTASQDQQVDNLNFRLKEVGISTIVEGVNFSASSKDKMYKNLSRLMKNVYQNKILVEKSFIKFGSHLDPVKKEKFIKQFIDLQKQVRNNMWKCSHPDGPQYHDDYTDSLALACWSLSVEGDSVGSFKFAFG